MDKHAFQIRARFRRALKESRIPDRARLLIAVSGGCDSVSLLHLCRDEAGARTWRLVVGHVDHALRPDSSADAGFVRDLSRSLGLPFYLRRVAASRWERLKGESIEAAARRCRRLGLLRLARHGRCEAILLGHTLDDQAETVLLNLLRGSGLRGLSGMSVCSPFAGSAVPTVGHGMPAPPAALAAPLWVRPLLRIPREEIREFATRRGLLWREDPSNLDRRFRRNRIRRELIPWLRAEFGPSTPSVLARTADTLGPIRRYLEEEAHAAWKRCCREESPAGIRLDRLELCSYHVAVIEEVLRRAYFRLHRSTRDLKRAHVGMLVRALASGRQGVFTLPAGIEAALDRLNLSFMHRRRSVSSQDGQEADQPE